MDPTIEALSYLALALDLIVGFYLVYYILIQLNLFNKRLGRV